MIVVYFEQCLGAARSKRMSKYAFSHFLHKKHKKGRTSNGIIAVSGRERLMIELQFIENVFLKVQFIETVCF